MRQYGPLVTVLVATLSLSGCQSTIDDVANNITNTLQDIGNLGEERAKPADYAVWHESGDQYFYQVRISAKVPLKEFRERVHYALSHESGAASEVEFYSTIADFDKNSLNFFDRSNAFNTFISSKELGEGKVISYEAPWLDMRFTTKGDYHVFTIAPRETKNREGNKGHFERGLYFNNGTKVENFQFDFDKFRKQVNSKLKELEGIAISIPATTRYNGSTTLSNDDVTAFANIQRLHNSTYLSSNKKNDSEKSGFFRTNEGDVLFHFSLYPYKGVSKVQYDFSLPSIQTYYSFRNGKSTPYKDDLDKNYNKVILKSALSSFND
ncbi:MULTISPECIES: hypothetical protein [Vibrio]|uniref:hypothetical protein n=1 Tax=Vibrio TaxID=662 RepID=UPI00222F8CEF|nr:MULTISPECIES: hypothetical protein [Vibrio]MDV5034800.1 hypothetical protein [Vibrio diabolicus]BDR21101.1 hypothetical protein VspSTUT16_44470 [Vibrio sp. STUT-A16]